MCICANNQSTHDGRRMDRDPDSVPVLFLPRNLHLLGDGTDQRLHVPQETLFWQHRSPFRGDCGNGGVLAAHLIDEQDVAVGILAELILCVDQQQAPRRRLPLAEGKQLQSCRADLSGEKATQVWLRVSISLLGIREQTKQHARADMGRMQKPTMSKTERHKYLRKQDCNPLPTEPRIWVAWFCSRTSGQDAC